MLNRHEESTPAALEALGRAGIESATMLVTLGSGQVNPWEGEETARVGYGDIPGWEEPGIEGHSGVLSLVDVGGDNVLVMEGRHHYYEARSYEAVIFPLKVVHALGARRALLTNSVGGINRELEAGNLVLIADHIFLQGLQEGEFLRDVWPRGRRPEYWREGGETLREAAAEAGIPLVDGVLLCVPGPMYETDAEIEMARRMGADVVAMSLAPEALAAQALGFMVAGLSLVTNISGEPGHTGTGHEDVVEAASRFQPVLSRLLREAVPRLVAL
jgi:purine-nucleoside phosphorylase